MPARTTALLTMLLLAGCGGVFARFPASDGATTRADDRLIGFWRVDYEASHAGADAGRDEGVVAVGRRSSTDPALHVTTLTLRTGEILESTTGELSPTTIATRDYVSVRSEGDKPEDTFWTVLRYDLPDADTLRVLSMDEKKAAVDVRSGAVKGKASESKDGVVTVTIDAATTALRAYLESRGDGVFRTERPLVLRRIHPR